MGAGQEIFGRLESGEAVQRITIEGEGGAVLVGGVRIKRRT